MKRVLGIAALGLAVVASPAVSQPPAIAEVSDADHAAISELSQEFFDRVEAIGVEQAMIQTFSDAMEVNAPQMIEIYRDIDQNCATMSGVELVRSTDFGSRVARRTYVTRQGNCFIKWEFMFVKRGFAWSYEGFHFETLNGNNWSYK